MVVVVVILLVVVIVLVLAAFVVVLTRRCVGDNAEDEQQPWTSSGCWVAIPTTMKKSDGMRANRDRNCL
jgi:Na+/glutamate symporter